MESEPPPLPVTAAKVPDSQTLPSYHELFGANRVEPAQTTETQTAQTNQSETESESRNISCSECLPSKSKVYPVLALIGIMLVFFTCITLIYFGAAHRVCHKISFLPDLGVASGALGIVYLILNILNLHKKQKGENVEGLKFWVFVFFPCVMSAVFLTGAGATYKIWADRLCDPFTLTWCNASGGYCDDTLMIFTLVFYSTGLLAFLPFIIYALFLLCKKLHNLLKNTVFKDT